MPAYSILFDRIDKSKKLADYLHLSNEEPRSDVGLAESECSTFKHVAQILSRNLREVGDEGVA